MANVVAEVGEIRRFGFEAFDDGEGLVDGGVGGVGFVTEGVEEEDVEVAELVHGFFGDLVVIGEVGDLADAITEYDHGAVIEGDGGDLLAEEFEGFAVEDVGGEAGDGIFFAGVGEDVFEDAADDGEGGFGAVYGDEAALAKVEGADVVEAEDVVGGGVGEEDGVEGADAGSKGLAAEIRRGIDDDAFAGESEPDGGAEAVIAGVC